MEKVVALFLVVTSLCMIQVSAAGTVAPPENYSQQSEIIPMGLVSDLNLAGIKANESVKFNDACGQYTVGTITISGD